MAMPEFFHTPVPVSDGTVVNKEVIEANNGCVPAFVTESEIEETKVNNLDDAENSERLEQIKQDKLGDLKDTEDANFINSLPETHEIVEDDEAKPLPKKRKAKAHSEVVDPE